MANKNRAPVADEESLLRAIFAPSFFAEDGFLSPSAFQLVIMQDGTRETGISVIRPAISGWEKFLERIKNRPRDPQDAFLGTIILIAGIVRNIHIKTKKEIKIEIIPTRRACHAEIQLYIDGQIVEAGSTAPEYLSFINHLAQMGRNQIKYPA